MSYLELLAPVPVLGHRVERQGRLSFPLLNNLIGVQGPDLDLLEEEVVLAHQAAVIMSIPLLVGIAHQHLRALIMRPRHLSYRLFCRSLVHLIQGDIHGHIRDPPGDPPAGLKLSPTLVTAVDGIPLHHLTDGEEKPIIVVHLNTDVDVHILLENVIILLKGGGVIRLEDVDHPLQGTDLVLVIPGRHLMNDVTGQGLLPTGVLTGLTLQLLEKVILETALAIDLHDLDPLPLGQLALVHQAFLHEVVGEGLPRHLILVVRLSLFIVAAANYLRGLLHAIVHLPFV